MRSKPRKKGPEEKYVIPVLDPPEQFYWGPEIDYHTAHALGLPRFFTGEPCIKGHIAERWTSSRSCVECRMQRNRLAEYREYATPVQREWIAGNPDLRREYNDTRNAKNAAKPVKSEARRESMRQRYAEWGGLSPRCNT